MSPALYYHRDTQLGGVNTVLISAMSTILERTTHSSSHDACINYTIEWLLRMRKWCIPRNRIICMYVHVLTQASSARNLHKAAVTPHFYAYTYTVPHSHPTAVITLPRAHCFTCQMVIGPLADEWSQVTLDSSVGCTSCSLKWPTTVELCCEYFKLWWLARMNVP